MATAILRARSPKTRTKLPIASIRVGPRARKDLGDLDSLAESIAQVGLLHAVVVSPDNRLIAGFRRLQAFKKLGWKTVPVRVIDLEKVVEGEFAENVCRKDFTLSEIANIAKKLRPLVEKRARMRQIASLKRGDDGPVRQNLHNGEGGKSRDIIAGYVGISGVSLEKIEAIVQAAEENPEKYGHLKEQMDDTGKVNHCFQQLRFAQLAQQKVLARGSRDRATYAPNVVCADCFDFIPTLKDGSVGLVVSSPPYCEQRRGQYAGVSEAEYPQWTTRWMRLLRAKLADDASVLIIIRPHLKHGVLSDYVLQTRLALREDGWKECEELIWLKPDAPPLGSVNRPRRTWESILWFSRSSHPYCDLTACGRASNRLGFAGSLRFGLGGESPISSHQNLVMKNGKSRCPDVFLAQVCEIHNGIDHPAMFPVSLAEQLIRTFSRQGDLVVDPFVGAGGTLLAAMHLRRAFLGCDVEAKYVKIARQRLAEKPGSLEEPQVLPLRSSRGGNGRHIPAIGGNNVVRRNGHGSGNGRQLARRAK